MMTRRDSVRLMAGVCGGALMAAEKAAAPALAPGTPLSPERGALIQAFERKAEGLDRRFESRSIKGSWEMPYRLFSPAGGASKIPLVMFLHGSSGLGTDNEKQLGLGNVFGTRVWALAETQKRFPCFIVA